MDLKKRHCEQTAHTEGVWPAGIGRSLVCHLIPTPSKQLFFQQATKNRGVGDVAQTRGEGDDGTTLTAERGIEKEGNENEKGMREDFFEGVAKSGSGVEGGRTP